MSPHTIAIIRILFIVAIGIVTNSLLQRGLRAMAERKYFGPTVRFIAAKVCRWGVIIVTLLLILQQTGISVQSLWASMSAILVLVAVGFIAFWSILSNISSALLLVVFAPFRIGDEIEVMEPAVLDPMKTGLRGIVVDISFLYTTLAENNDPKVLIRIPNSLFFQKAIRIRRGEKTESLQHNLFDGNL